MNYIVAVVLYGTIGMFLRHVRLPSEIVAMCRGIIGSAFILIYLRIRHRKPDRAAICKNLKWLLLAGISLRLNWIFLFAAYMKTTVAIASLCNYMAPIIVILVAPVALKDRPDIRKMPCVTAALVGIVLVSGVQNGSDGSISGAVLELSAAYRPDSISISYQPKEENKWQVSWEAIS